MKQRIIINHNQRRIIIITENPNLPQWHVDYIADYLIEQLIKQNKEGRKLWKIQN